MAFYVTVNMICMDGVIKSPGRRSNLLVPRHLPLIPGVERETS